MIDLLVGAVIGVCLVGLCAAWGVRREGKRTDRSLKFQIEDAKRRDAIHSAMRTEGFWKALDKKIAEENGQ